MEGMLNTLHEFNTVSILFRIALSMLVSGILGFERGLKNRPAGLKTYMLVAVGACIVMLTGEFLYMDYGSDTDPSRLAAQVVSGIGFLGAGTIIVTGGNKVRGITTAASVWTAACLGIACGIGFYQGVFAGTIAVIMIMFIFSRLDKKIKEHAQHFILKIEFDDYENITDFYEFFSSELINVESTNVLNKGKNNNENAEVVFSIDLNGHFEEDTIIQLESIEGVKSVKRINKRTA